MIVCPNCAHQNPDGATQCEACYTPLPTTTSCPNCGAVVQTDATFCGQCGFSLKPSSSLPDPEGANSQSQSPTIIPLPPDPATPAPPTMVTAPPLPPEPDIVSTPTPASAPEPSYGISKTQLQEQTARLLHVQTDKTIELPQNLPVIHVGKPNDQIPPDIDVSGFPNSEIVSRIHADIRVEGEAYYLEDVGSANGTYLNHIPLPKGNRHRLRPGDRISLGKGDMMTFLFQTS